MPARRPQPKAKPTVTHAQRTLGRATKSGTGSTSTGSTTGGTVATSTPKPLVTTGERVVKATPTGDVPRYLMACLGAKVQGAVNSKTLLYLVKTNRTGFDVWKENILTMDSVLMAMLIAAEFETVDVALAVRLGRLLSLPRGEVQAFHYTMVSSASHVCYTTGINVGADVIVPSTGFSCNRCCHPLSHDLPPAPTSQWSWQAPPPDRREISRVISAAFTANVNLLSFLLHRCQFDFEFVTDALLAACVGEHREVLRWLTRIIVDKEITSNGHSPFDMAAGEEFEFVKYRNLTPLAIAAAKGWRHGVTDLIRFGASKEFPSSTTVSPVVVAVKKGDCRMLKHLIASGLSVRSAYDSESVKHHVGHPVRHNGHHVGSPLSIAILNKRADVMRVLLAAGVDPMEKLEDRRSPLEVAWDQVGIARKELRSVRAGDPKAATARGEIEVAQQLLNVVQEYVTRDLWPCHRRKEEDSTARGRGRGRGGRGRGGRGAAAIPSRSVGSVSPAPASTTGLTAAGRAILNNGMRNGVRFYVV